MRMQYRYLQRGQIMISDGDPFDCFGNGDDDDHGDADHSDTNAPSDVIDEPNIQRRDPNNGILTFHAGTEQALLHHVRQEMRSVIYSGCQDRAAAVLGHVDEFSLRRHWMMHVGHDKGPIIEDFLKECYEAHAENYPDSSLAVLEIGTYCGYSSILLAKALKSFGCKFRLCSVEVVAQNAQIAKKMVDLAGLQDCIEISLLDPEKQSLEDHIKQNLGSSTIDFLFLDHDKSLYLAYLQQLEQSGFIKKGCFVAADNVVFAQIDDYRHYIGEHVKHGAVRTKLAMSWLEYCEPDHDDNMENKNLMKDGIELTIYMKDP